MYEIRQVLHLEMSDASEKPIQWRERDKSEKSKKLKDLQLQHMKEALVSRSVPKESLSIKINPQWDE